MKAYLSIDIGGTDIKYALFQLDHANLEKKETKVIRNWQQTLTKSISEEILNLVKEINPIGVGIATAGVVDPNSGEVIYAGPTIPNYIGTNFKKLIEEAGIPCEVENDVNAACLGECWMGSIQSEDTAYCLAVGTGIGGAFLSNKQIFHGIGFTAGEIGYMQTKYGQFQETASTVALVNACQQAGFYELDNGKKIIEAAKAGDSKVVNLIDEWLDRLVAGIINVIYLVNPETVLLGGGIMEAHEFFDERLKVKITQNIQSDLFFSTQLKYARLGNDAGLYGAIYHLLNKKGELAGS